MSGIDEKMRRAIEEGIFDNLPGKGKPLKLKENPHEDPEWRVAYHMLRNGGFTLPWIELRQNIESDLQELRDRLRSAIVWRQSALKSGRLQADIEADWQQSRADFRAGVAALNEDIRSYNLQIPTSRFHMLVCDPDLEEQWLIGDVA